MPKAITCVKHGRWKLYWTGWRHVQCNMLLLVAQWYAVCEDTVKVFYASYPGQVGEMFASDSMCEVTREPDQIAVLPSTPHKTKCRIKGELLLKLVNYLDEHGS